MLFNEEEGRGRMKKLDLNIDVKVDKEEKDAEGKLLSVVNIAIMWMGAMMERSMNKPDPRTNRPTACVGMQQQKKYFRVMQVLEGHKDGLVEMEDDDFSFLDKKFHGAEMPIQKGVTGALVAISNLINKAKV